MSDKITSTATTRDAQIVAQPNVDYRLAAPRGQVLNVRPHPPTRRS